MYYTEAQRAAFVEAFEAHSVPTDARFSHHEHVLVAWHVLRRRHPPTRAIQILRDGLRAIAVSRGKPDHYHETITWAFATLIHERLARIGPEATWDEFRSCNEDLFEWEASIERHYSRAVLDSDLARRVFVLPDRGIAFSDHDGM